MYLCLSRQEAIVYIYTYFDALAALMDLRKDGFYENWQIKLGSFDIVTRW